MTNFAAALKTEILRLARKEVRKELEGLRKTSAQHRSEIAELKRQIAQLKKQKSRPEGKVSGKKVQASEAGDQTSLRFNAKGFASHRTRLRLSAAEAGQLIGVSLQTVYGWENEKSKPRRSQFAAIAAFRGLGKRQARALLATKAE